MIDWQIVQELGPYSWRGIGTALLCGAIVGLERQIRGKPVGIRTSALIILGTYLFLVVIVGVLLGVDLLEDTFQSLTRGVHRKYSGWRRRRGDSNEP